MKTKRFGRSRRPRRRATRQVALAAVLAVVGQAQAATFTVTNNFDFGAGSFRQAVIDAAANGNGPDVIDFDPGLAAQTITLGTPLDPFDQDLVVDSTAAPGVRIVGLSFSGISTGTLTLQGGMFDGNLAIDRNIDLDPTATITGNATISSGALLRNDGMIDGTTDIAAGGSVIGGGDFDGDTTSAGNLNAGIGAGDIDTLDFNSDLSITGGNVRVDIDDAGTVPDDNNDLYNVAGNVTLSGGTVNVNAIPGTYTDGRTFMFLTAGGTVTGKFDGITDNLAFFDAMLIYDTDNVSFRLNEINTSFAEVAATCNQIAIGTYVDSLRGGAAGDLLDVIDALRMSTTESVQTGLDQLGGQIFPSLVSAQLQQTTFTMAMLRDQLMLDTFDRPTGYPTRGWVRGYGAGGDAERDNCGTRGFNYQLGGTEIGLQRGFANGVDVGLFTNLAWSEVSTVGIRQEADVDSYQFGGSTQYVGAHTYVLGIGGFGYQQYQTRRTIRIDGSTVNRVAESDFDGSQSFGMVEVGKLFASDTTVWAPHLSTQYIRLDQDDIDETGADTVNLSGDAIDAESLRSILGLSIQKTGLTGLGPATTKLRLGWMHEFLDTNETFVSSFDGQTERVTIEGIDLGRDWAVVGVNLEWTVFRSATLLAAYQGQANSTQSLHTGAVGLETRW